MPGHRVHRFVDRQFFGKSFWRIHAAMDLPYLYLGSNHRVLFHDEPTAFTIAKELYPNDPFATYAALNHIWLDRACTNDPCFKAKLEYLAKIDAKKRARFRKEKRIGKQRRKRKAHKSRKQTKDPFKEFEKFYREVKQIFYYAYELSK